ncbi:CYTH domain-containing protein [Streptococcus iniae]|nr:CYTH domain-containing protein [Streptococcus iniae]
MPNLEIEYKTLLTKDEYNRLLVKLSHIEPLTQTNYYIDTPNFDLKANRMSLRIRTFNDSAEMTLKVPEKIGNREYNVSLDLIVAKQLVKNFQLDENSIKEMIAQTSVDCGQLECFGFLTTTRRETDTAIGKMALDYNHYSSVIDYELELEVDDPIKGQNDFDKFLLENQISFKYAKSKVARFTKTLRNRS